MENMIPKVLFGFLMFFGSYQALLEDCPNPCTQGGQKYCHPIPCPAPPCNNTYTPAGACCPECWPPKHCPYPCSQGDQKFCAPPPCPLPPCKNYYTPPWACCAQCVMDPNCPHPCTVNGHKFCEPPPCPPPPPTCKNPYTPEGECCEICPNETMISITNTTTTNCPHPCEQGGKQYCYPLPCPLPPCVDPVTPKGACCPTCPNGHNCMIEGHIYPAHKDTIHNGKVCRCFGHSGKCEDIEVS